MEVPILWWVVVALASFCLVAFYWAVRKHRQLADERSRRQSLSTRYGQMTEQFLPFIDSYPWNPGNFRFLGSPVDGIQFEEDKIIIVEFKVGTSRQTKTQRRIRQLVEAHKVEFQEIRIR